MKKHLRTYSLLLLISFVSIIIAYLTLAPAPLVRPIRRYIRIKNGHRLAYCVLTFLLLMGLRKTRVTILSAHILALVITTAFGALLEFGQSFTLTREGDIHDIAINFTGAFAASVLMLTLEFLMWLTKKLKYT